MTPRTATSGRARRRRESAAAREIIAPQEYLPEGESIVPADGTERAGQELTFTVAGTEGGMRLDVFLARHAPDSASRSRLSRLVLEGRVEVAGERAAKAGQKLRAGQHVRLHVPAPAPCAACPEDIPLRVVYEDDALLVVDKPAGLVVHPAPGNTGGTLVNALLHHCRDLSGIGGELRPGIVHRLDKETSGLIVVAKSDGVHRRLSLQFKRHEVHKTYRALVWGDVAGDEGVIDAPIGRHPVMRKQMSTRSRRGRDALTRWRVCERYGILTLLDVVIETGRTHQIRVHLASRGHAILGDKLYGGSAAKTHREADALVRARLLAMKRQALHAAALRFTHPATGREVAFTAPLPADMERLIVFFRARQVGVETG